MKSFCSALSTVRSFLTSVSPVTASAPLAARCMSRVVPKSPLRSVMDVCCATYGWRTVRSRPDNSVCAETLPEAGETEALARSLPVRLMVASASTSRRASVAVEKPVTWMLSGSMLTATTGETWRSSPDTLKLSMAMSGAATVQANCGAAVAGAAGGADVDVGAGADGGAGALASASRLMAPFASRHACMSPPARRTLAICTERLARSR